MPQTAKRKLRWHNGGKIKLLRKQRKLTQEQLAEAVSVHLHKLLPTVSSPDLILTQSLLSDLEVGRTELSVLHLYGLSSFFNVPLEEFLTFNLQTPATHNTEKVNPEARNHH